ncbi:MAG: hypothetical protein WBJ42_01055 [Thermovirgaceae bacterium]
MEAGMIPFRKMKAMALPLTLIFLLVGAVLVGGALYVVENMFSTSSHVVSDSQLYNAAQSGIEQGKMAILENRKDLDRVEREYEGNLDKIRAIKKDSQFPLDEDLQEMPIDGLPGVEVTVDILDCNYRLEGLSFSPNQPGKEELSQAQREALPPRVPFIDGSGGGEVDDSQFLYGYSNVIDPNRNISPGGGRLSGHHYVIRSTATAAKGTGKEKVLSIETMVVVTHD